MMVGDEETLDGMVLPASTIHMEIDDPVGRGGFGTVYRGHSDDLGLVAVKRLISDGVIPNRDVRDMLKEARRLKEAFHHPAIVNLKGVVMERDNYSLVLEYVLFGSSVQFVSDYDVAMALRVQMIQQVISAMDYLHSHTPPILHLDLKADNVLIDKHFNAKICDFGLSQWKTVTVTVTRGMEASRRCTVTHVPPEVWNDVNIAANTAYDIYCFAVTMWEILTGQVPYGTPNPDLIKQAVLSRQRPDRNALPADTPFLLQQMMFRCWSEQSAMRPPFSRLKTEIEALFKKEERKVVGALKKIRRQICERFLVNDVEYTDTEYIEDLEEMEEPETEDQSQSPPSPVYQEVAMETDTPTPGTSDNQGTPAEVQSSPLGPPRKKLSLPIKRELTHSEKQMRSILRDPLSLSLWRAGFEETLFMTPENEKLMENDELLLDYINNDVELKMELMRCNHGLFSQLNGAKMKDSAHQGRVDQMDKKDNDYFHFGRFRGRRDSNPTVREQRRDRAREAMLSSSYGNRLFNGGMGQKLSKALKEGYHLKESYGDSNTGTGGAEKFEMIDPKVIEAAEDPILLQITFAKDPETLDTMMRCYPELTMKLIAKNKTNYRENRDEGRGGGGGGGGGGGFGIGGGITSMRRMERPREMDRLDDRIMPDMEVDRRLHHREMYDDGERRRPAMKMPTVMRQKESLRNPSMAPPVKMKEEPRRPDDFRRERRSFMNAPDDMDRMKSLRLSDSGPKRSKMEEEKDRMEIIKVLLEATKEQQERKRKDEEEEKQRMEKQRKEEDEKRKKREKEEKKKQSEENRKSWGNSQSILGSMLGMFTGSKPDRSLQPELSLRNGTLGAGPLIVSMDAAGSSVSGADSSTSSVSSAPATGVTNEDTSKPVMVTSKDQGATSLLPRQQSPLETGKPPSPVMSPKLETPPVQVKLEPKTEKMDTDPGAMGPGIGARTGAQGSGGGAKPKSPTEILHQHSGGSVTKITFKDTKKLPNLQIGDKNTMIVGARLPSVADDDEIDRKKSKKKSSSKKKKVKLTTSEKAPNKDSFDVVCQEIGKDWRKLARELGLSDGEVELVYQDYNASGMYEVTYQVLQRWLQRNNTAATARSLAEKLLAIDRDDLAKQIK